jgi:hypothetical protein
MPHPRATAYNVGVCLTKSFRGVGPRLKPTTFCNRPLQAVLSRGVETAQWEINCWGNSL